MHGPGSRAYLLSMIRLQADTQHVSACLEPVSEGKGMLLRASGNTLWCRHGVCMPINCVSLTKKSFVPMSTMMPFTLIPSGLSPCWMRHSRFSDVSPAGATQTGSGHVANVFVAEIAEYQPRNGPAECATQLNRTLGAAEAVAFLPGLLRL